MPRHLRSVPTDAGVVTDATLSGLEKPEDTPPTLGRALAGGADRRARSSEEEMLDFLP